MPPKKEKPEIIPGMRRASIRVTVVGRDIKMLRPICATCQRGSDIPEDWWKSCTHGPYVSAVEVSETKPQYEDLDDGTKRLTGRETIVHWEERPNWVQVPHHPRVGSETMVERKQRRYGFIFPEELRSPLFPNGIVNPCEFRDCFIQTELKDYQWGRFCRKVEAQLVGHDLRMDGGGGALEIGEGMQSAEKQRRQLEAVPL